MWWRKGWFLDTLNYRIEKELRETIYKNETYKEYRWNLLQRFIIYLSRHYLISNIILAALILTSSVLQIVPVVITNWISNNVSLEKLPDTLLTAQLSSIALIFALVVGFVNIAWKNAQL